MSEIILGIILGFVISFIRQRNKSQSDLPTLSREIKEITFEQPTFETDPHTVALLSEYRKIFLN